LQPEGHGGALSFETIAADALLQHLVQHLVQQEQR
jgi:hypothetical protein